MVDNIAIQAIETQLLGELGDLLSPARVVQMKADMINKIAAESSDSRSQRERMTRKLVVLTAGFEMCKKHIGRPMTSQSMFLTLNSAIANCSDLQHRPWHSAKHVFEDDSEPELIYHISDSEDVNSQEVVSALVMDNVEHQ